MTYTINPEREKHYEQTDYRTDVCKCGFKHWDHECFKK